MLPDVDRGLDAHHEAPAGADVAAADGRGHVGGSDGARIEVGLQAVELVLEVERQLPLERIERGARVGTERHP